MSKTFTELMNQHDGNREPNGTEKQHGGNKSGLWVDHQANRQSPELLIEINDFVRRQLDKDIIHKIKDQDVAHLLEWYLSDWLCK